MADKPITRICSINNCGKLEKARRLCVTHYGRWQRTGKLTINRATREQLLAFLHKALFEHNSDECLLWPYGKSKRGYGILKVPSIASPMETHRYICIEAHGEPPSQKHHAAHRCGTTSCINPRHLRWATPTENSMDALEHGTRVVGERHCNARLSDSQVREIRDLRGKMFQKEIAARFGISQSCVSMLWRGQRRRHP